MNKVLLRFIPLFCLINIWATGEATPVVLLKTDSVFVLKKQNYTIKILKKGFRYSILRPDKSILLQNHSSSGLVLLGSPVTDSRLISKSQNHAEFVVVNTTGITATVNIFLFDHFFKFSVKVKDNPLKGSIIARTKGLSPAFGLADHAAYREPYSTEVSGFQSNYFGALSTRPFSKFVSTTRLVSNFLVFPKQGLACINLEPRKKIVKVNKNLLVQGTYYSNEMPALYYFIGSVKQIYADYLEVRNKEGYKVYKVYRPKYALFGVGWEAFGALGWRTNHKTVSEDVDHYLRLGFPLSWMILGSGFWPDDPRHSATTSFGLWDTGKYPDPERFIDYFHNKGLKFLIGLRIAFIPGGPFTQEGVENGYFIKKDRVPRLFKINFPKPECYFLDASNPEAVKWYVGLYDKWKEYGIDGYKEDLSRYEVAGLPDDKLNAVNEAFMEQGVNVMGRNGYVGSPMDISRYNDFNYDENQDRGPVNGLAYAYSGYPNVYPDIIGGTGLTNKQFGEKEKKKIGKYLMREAQYAAVNPSMSFGFGPWNLDNPHVVEVCRKAAQLHDRLQSYIYSAAIRSYKTGFPYTLTPLPLAYPHDSVTYYRENDKVRGYQWMIGDALMAVPLYGNDYATSNTRNIYLPAGKWIDYDNGKVYQGPVTLKDFTIPVDKTPLFVGGTGFVVEKIKGKLYGRIYGVGFEGKTVFYDKDGETKSVISINPAQDAPSIVDETVNKEVKAKYTRFAYEFTFIPGHNYKIK